jgi:uncharacterized phage protein (TIGR01671 family)
MKNSSRYKFRAWDKEKRKLSKPFQFHDIRAYQGLQGLERNSIWFSTDDENDNIEIGNNLGFGQNDNKEMCKRYEFIQYTGLKDSKGKEIYEGYILEKTYNCSCGKEYKKRFHIIFSKGSYIGYDNIETWNTLLYIDQFSDSKIIGNIYENPELLKEEK